jgi:hypothetical protein
MAMSGRNAAALWQKKQQADYSDIEGTDEPSSSTKAKVSAVAVTPQPLISESEPMDTTPTGNAWAAEETVNPRGRILYEVNSDQCDFELYYSSGRGIVEEMLRVITRKEWWKFLFIFCRQLP